MVQGLPPDVVDRVAPVLARIAARMAEARRDEVEGYVRGGLITRAEGRALLRQRGIAPGRFLTEPIY